MRGISVFSLIAFCVLALRAGNNGLAEGHSVKDYLRGLFTLKQLPNLRHGILPGTLWCGLGDIARNDLELGTYTDMDKCCRAHDRCEDYIESKETRYGLHNRFICRSSLCECEMQFYNCLKQIRGFYPYAVRKVYFRACRNCFRIFHDSRECTNQNLDIIEEPDRKGRRVFCAKFDRYPKWGGRHGITTPKSIPAGAPPAGAGDEYIQIDPRIGFEDDGKDYNEENDIDYDSYESIDDDY